MSKKRAIRIDPNKQKYIPRTSNIALYYADVNDKTDVRYSNKKTEELLRKYQTSQGLERIRIRNKIVELNLKLVISIARQYCGCNDNLLDLIEEGNMALIKAVDKYDVNKESCFAKIAVYIITGAINYYKIRTANVVVSKNRHGIYAVTRDITNEYLQKENRNPTCEELMDEYNRRLNKNCKVKEDFLEPQIVGIDAYNGCSSSDNPYLNMSQERYDYTLATCSSNDYEVEIDKAHNKEIIRTYLNLLTPKEAEVIKLIYGLEDSKKTYNYKDIGEKLKLTPERIGQIHLRTINKLKQKLVPNYNDSQN
jgi:RNA polymerase sigma factor (sigma-70 family)